MPIRSKRLTAQEVANAYRQRSEQFASRAVACAKGIRLVRIAYQSSFLVAVACFAQVSPGEPHSARWLIAFLGLLATAVVAILAERRLQSRFRVNELSRQINDHALARMGRSWAEVPGVSATIPEPCAAQAEDLDLFGQASLFHLLCRAQTPLGISKLRDWLLAPAAPDEIRRRQRAVAELSVELSFRQDFEVRTTLLGREAGSFLEWVEDAPWLPGRPWTRRFLLVQSVLPLLALLCASVGIVSIGVGVGTMCAACLLNLLITGFLGGRVHDLFRRAAPREGIAWEYLRLFELISRLPGDSDLAIDLRQAAVEPREGAVRGLRQLALITVFGYAHRDPLKIAMYLPLQCLLLWDFHLLRILEGWQRRWEPRCRHWFGAVAELEAICSLACLAQENPDWCFPDVDESHAKGIDARGLGHPLLGDDVRVRNDVTLGPPQTFLLISGSNMSGKSTLLRAIGLNVILAQAGGPVCATQWTMTPVLLATAIRIDDSLVDGISLFLAGLYRVKEVVARAEDLADHPDRTLIYLLDEPLQGTNARERRIAQRKVLGQLLEHGAVGVVSTHDVELACDGPLADVCVRAHFQETIDRSCQPVRITFDYRLRPGESKSTNALELLKLVGLG